MVQVCIVMPAYNCEAYVEQAIDSLLDQTLRDFSLVVVNDGSTDRTGDRLASYRDARMRVVTQDNAGTAAALNRGIAETSGDLIAIAHGDDVNYPERLARQVDWMLRHPDVTALGTSYRAVDPSGRPMYVVPVLTSDKELRRDMYVRSPFGHPTMMLRRAAVQEAGGYRQSWWPAEDYDLWRRLPGQLANLPNVLLDYREHPGATSRAAQELKSSAIRAELWAAGRPPALGPIDLVSGLVKHREQPRFFLGRQRAVLRAVAEHRRQAA